MKLPVNVSSQFRVVTYGSLQCVMFGEAVLSLNRGLGRKYSVHLFFLEGTLSEMIIMDGESIIYSALGERTQFSNVYILEIPMAIDEGVCVCVIVSVITEIVSLDPHLLLKFNVVKPTIELGEESVPGFKDALRNGVRTV